MSKRRWLVLAFLAAFLLLAKVGVSGALEHGWARRSLLTRLSASFGRPVEVGRFRVNLLSGLRLEADSVTVAEDPRFGQEYFLRAQQLTAGLRWTALLRGRIEFGDVSVSSPSLNLVRLADGSWNIESWLPPAAPQAQAGATSETGDAAPSETARRVTARLSRLDVDSGRINFKLGDEKLPFALVGVTGSVEQDSSGRWSIDLAADPMRAPIPLQNVGEMRLQGSVAGTSARLRPAAFALTWDGASLADALRLLDGTDHGMRGALSAQLVASSASPASAARGASASDSVTATGQWSLQGAMRLSGVHRWDLGESPLDPAINASFAANWQPGEPRLKVARLTVEAPHSRVNATASLDWSHGLMPSMQLVSSRIGLGDLLAWRHVLLPGITDDASAEGTVSIDATAAGWPLRLEQVHATSSSAVIRAPSLPGPLRVGRVDVTLQRGTLSFGPVSVSLPGAALKERNAPEPASAGALQIAGTLGPKRSGDTLHDWQYRLAVSGDTQRVQDLIAVARAFGRLPPSAEWSVQGPAALNLSWTGALRRGTSMANGTLDLHDLQVTSVALNQPISVVSASVAIKGAERQVHLTAVQALGTHWTGTLHRRAADRAWDFDLSADRLDPAEIDLWLGAGAHPGLLGRILPFAASRSSALLRDAVFARVAAHGRLRVGEVLLTPLRVAKLDADAELDGRKIVLRRAQADFYGGRLSGELNALLAAEPFYSFRGRLDRVDLASLTNSSPSLAGQFEGAAAGELTLEARGIGRQPLAASLTGEGILRVRNAIIRGLDLGLVTGRAADSEPGGESRYSTAAVTFHIADDRVRMDQILLVGRDEQLELDGSVSFARQLDLHARSVPRDLARAPETDSQDAEADAWAIGGSLDAPQVRLQTPVAGGDRAIAAGARR